MHTRNIRLLLLTALTIFASTSIDAQSIARFYTSSGDFDVELREDLVPITANNFMDLCNVKFYDHVIWHRIVPNFVIQSGDPTGTGSGGPGYTIQDEFHPQLNHNSKGILSMANAGPNTGGSQFFITLAPASHLNNAHSVFGSVISGITSVDSIAGTPLNGNGTPVFPPVNDSIRVISTATSIHPSKPGNAILGANYPNPFSEATSIAFGVKELTSASLRILDATGKRIRQFDLGLLHPGDHRHIWDGNDDQGNPVADGLYFYQLQTANFSDARPMILAR